MLVDQSIRIYVFEDTHPEKGSIFYSSIFYQLTTHNRTIHIEMEKPESIMVPHHGKKVTMVGDVRWVKNTR